jgi:hypothetical protein
MENPLKSRFDPEMTEVALRCLATILTPSLGGIVLLMLPVVNLIKPQSINGTLLFAFDLTATALN